MLRTFLIHFMYLLFSGFLAHLTLSHLKGNISTQMDYLYLGLLTLLFYAFLINFHVQLYMETFEIDPNIQDANTQAYQEDNYQQEKAFEEEQKRMNPGSTINIFVDDNPEINPVSPRWKTSYGLTPDDPNLKANALEQAPDTNQFRYDDGNEDHTPKVDQSIMDQIQTHVQQEVAKHYQNGLEEGNLAELKPLVAQKLEDRMPYLSNQIRRVVMDNLDDIIDAQLNKMLGQPKKKTENRIQPLVIPPRNEQLQTDFTGRPYYPPEAYMEHMAQQQADTKAYYEVPRAAYQSLNKDPSEYKFQPQTYIENESNGKKMSTKQLFDSNRSQLQSNDMQNKWNVRPWAF